MIVSELIKLLLTMPQDLEVYNKGYYEPVEKVEIKIVENSKEEKIVCFID